MLKIALIGYYFTVAVDTAESDLHWLEFSRKALEEIHTIVVAKREPLLEPACPACLRCCPLYTDPAHRTAIAPRAPVERMRGRCVHWLLLWPSDVRVGDTRNVRVWCSQSCLIQCSRESYTLSWCWHWIPGSILWRRCWCWCDKNCSLDK